MSPPPAYRATISPGNAGRPVRWVVLIPQARIVFDLLGFHPCMQVFVAERSKFLTSDLVPVDALSLRSGGRRRWRANVG